MCIRDRVLSFRGALNDQRFFELPGKQIFIELVNHGTFAGKPVDRNLFGQPNIINTKTAQLPFVIDGVEVGSYFEFVKVEEVWVISMKQLITAFDGIEKQLVENGNLESYLEHVYSNLFEERSYQDLWLPLRE